MKRIFFTYETGYRGMEGHDCIEYPDDVTDEELDDDAWHGALNNAESFGLFLHWKSMKTRTPKIGIVMTVFLTASKVAGFYMILLSMINLSLVVVSGLPTKKLKKSGTYREYGIS